VQDQQDERLTIRRAADEAGVMPPTIRHWIKPGLLESVQEGQRHFVMRSQLARVRTMTTTAQLQQLRHEVTTLQATLIPRIQRLEHLVDYLLVQGRIVPADMHPWPDQPVSKVPSKRSLAKWFANHGGGHGIPSGTIMG
jgi:hypothetical protein